MKNINYVESSRTDIVASVTRLRVSFPADDGWRTVVRGITFDINASERIAVVGESGSGKTMLGLSLLGLTPENARVEGKIEIEGCDIQQASLKQKQKLRGSTVSMVFQDPLTSLNPVRTVGSQLAESIRRHQKTSKAEAKKIAIETMGKIGVPAPRERFNTYPHELSGGLRQRIVIALALVNHPKLVIADEPTTALDSTIQAQILEVFKADVQEQSIVLITHDLAVAAEVCTRVLVMYAGKIVEDGQIEEVLEAPQHPYTAGLLAAVPSFHTKEELKPIPGAPPVDPGAIVGCRFAPRCPLARDKCTEEEPSLINGVACWFPNEVSK